MTDQIGRIVFWLGNILLGFLQCLRWGWLVFMNTTTTTTTTTPLLLLDNLPSTITSTSSNNMIILGARSSHHSPVSMEDITLGNLQCRRWMCCARKKLWWMAPEWGTSVRQLPPETQFLLLELDDGVNYAIVLPLIDNNTFRSTLRPPR